MNVFELFAKLSLDDKEYEEGLDSAEGKASSFGSKVAKGLGVIGKGTAIAIGTAATGISILTKKSVDAYGEFQQLEGGVKKLFGDDFQTVMDNASNAYKTAGMSANTYMDTVTSFSGSLIQSLGGDTAEAARVADIALKDMSDNFNTFGGDLESVMNAYKGFSKDNFMMLDNLKLGYGGTADEMARLVKDSGILGDAAEDLTGKNLKEKVSFAQMIEAIHAVQEQMNIAGTTTNEAATTIQGSLGMMRGAWDNLIAGLSNPDADLGVLIDQMVEAAGAAINNLVPTITTALKGIATLIEKIVPVITEQLPILVNELLPPLLRAATQLITALVSALPSILSVLTQQLPSILMQVLNAILEILPQLVDVVLQLIFAVADFLVDNIDVIIQSVVKMILAITDKLTDPETVSKLLHAGVEIMIAVAEGLIEGIPQLLANIPKIIGGLISGMVDFLTGKDPNSTAKSDMQGGLDALISGLVTAPINIVVNTIKGTVYTIGELLGMTPEEIEIAWTEFGNWWGYFWSLDFWVTDLGNWGADILEAIGNWGADILESIGNWGKKWYDAFIGWWQKMFVWYDNIWGGTQNVKNYVAESTDSMSKSAATSALAIKQAMEGTAGSVNTSLDKMDTSNQQHLTNMTNTADQFAADYQNYINTTYGIVEEKIEESTGSMQETVETSSESMKDSIQTSFGEATETVDQFALDYQNYIDTAFGNSENKVDSSLDSMKKDIDSSFNEMKKDASTFSNNFGKEIDTTFGNAENTVFSSVNNMKNDMDFDWSLPKPTTPSFKVSGGKAPWGFLGQGSLPKVAVEWHAKAMENPYLLDSATIFGFGGGKALGGGETGAEVIYGRDNLLRDIGEVVDSRLSKMQFVVPVYIGTRKIDQQIVTATARNNAISGGR